MAKIDESLARIEAELKRLAGGVARATAAGPSDGAVERRLDDLASRVDRALAAARAARAALE